MSRKPDPICPYCERTAQLVRGDRIYPHRPDLKHKRFWLCQKCNAYCGCHPNSKRPLGSLANAETREARKRAHALFDPLWKRGPFTRTKAYHWLCGKTGIPASQCHIGNMTVDQCKLVVDAVLKFKDKETGCPVQ